MPGMAASMGLVHEETTSDPPTSRPERSIMYRSVPVVALKMVAREPPGQVDAAAHAAVDGRGLRAGKEPLEPRPVRMRTSLSTAQPGEG